MQLSLRLSAIADLVTEGNRLVDVGCDHGYLPVYLIQQKKIPSAIAMDVRKGPLSRAQEHIRQYGLEEYIQTRLSDGLEGLKAGEGDTLVIAGMGGPLMERILTDGRSVRNSFSELILQPQSDIPHFRRFIQSEGWEITEEKMTEETLEKIEEIFQEFLEGRNENSKKIADSVELYEKELEINNRLVSLLNRENNKRNLNKKMDSDRKILNYKQDVKFATELNTKKDKVYIAGALVIKYQNRVQILMSGYDKKYKRFEANYYLHDEILKYYQKNYDYAELNGLTGDFSKDNPYLGLNEFKIGFNPRIYEYIGEFDLPLNEKKYLKMRSNGELAKIFNKPNQKVKKVMREKND